ncbi:hypothetical protein [Streptomyces sp. NPDC051572]
MSIAENPVPYLTALRAMSEEATESPTRKAWLSAGARAMSA